DALISSGARKSRATARHRKTPATSVPAAFWSFRAAELWCPNGAVTLLAPREYWDPPAAERARWQCERAAPPAAQFDEPSTRRAKHDPRNADVTEHPRRTAAPVHDPRSVFHPRSTPESVAPVLAGGRRSPPLCGPYRCAPRPFPGSIETHPSNAGTREQLPSHSGLPV